MNWLRPIRLIGANTFREVIRDRILYSLIVFAVLLLLISLALGELSFDENLRISANFGFTGIHIVAMAVAIFIGSNLVAKEIEKQTILTLLARPLTRSQFIAGKALGLLFVVIAASVALGGVLAAFLAAMGFEFQASYLIALYGIVLEAALLLSFTLLFGTFSKPIMTVVFSASMFLLGHWVDSLNYFISKSKSEVFTIVAKTIQAVVPDLEKLNWRAAPIYKLHVESTEVLSATLWSGFWIIFLLSLTMIIFRRRDFV